MLKPVILDRDGVINEDSDAYVKSAEEWLPISGSIEAIAQLSKAGFTVLVATNQSGIGRGLFDEFALAVMHQKMASLVEEAGGVLGGVFFCPHLPTDNCQCRKPRTGLLDTMEKEFGISLQGAPYVGDSLKDLQCARAKGCQPVLVLTGKGAETAATSPESELEGVTIFSDLAGFVQHYLETSGKWPA
ncbi:MAG: hypothetical protein RLZZ385_745 [Pseudomonadota bacterium]|jgi:D-glycero-D-manno-heptose 1,7-bisphosphate phosphatase